MATLLLSAPAVIFAVAPPVAAWLEYDRQALVTGEPWRAITCHWTHWSLDHLAWDLAAFVVMVALAWRASPRRTLATLAAAAALIPLAVWFVLPGMTHYRGLSGLDSALFMLIAVRLVREELAAGRRGLAAAVALVVAGFLGKIGFELATGATLFADSSSFVPVPLAHVVGGLCGALAALHSGWGSRGLSVVSSGALSSSPLPAYSPPPCSSPAATLPSSFRTTLPSSSRTTLPSSSRRSVLVVEDSLLALEALLTFRRGLLGAFPFALPLENRLSGSSGHAGLRQSAGNQGPNWMSITVDRHSAGCQCGAVSAFRVQRINPFPRVRGTARRSGRPGGTTSRAPSLRPCCWR